MRSDPSDTGGLFLGRRPGAAPTRFRGAPPQGDERRRRADGVLANLLFAAMIAISLLCWGPIPVACLWLGSRADYALDSAGAGIVVSFASAGIALFGSLSALGKIDRAWILVRRAAGRDQRTGMLARIFAAAAVIGAAAFTFWFLVILGPNDPNL
jgi:hypothetical protein